MGASSAGSSDDAHGSTESSLGSWGASAADPTWTPIEASADAAAAASGEGEQSSAGSGSGRPKRPTAYGLPPVTEPTSNLRSTINDALTTKPPSPLSRLGAAAAGAAAAVGSAASSAANSVGVGSHDSSAEQSGAEVGAGDTANAQAPQSAPAGTPPIDLDRLKALSAQRPELVIGAAFVGGLLLAAILKRLAR